MDSITEDQVTPKTKQWFTGEYGYVFENVVMLEKPIEVSPPKGAIIWWTVRGKDLARCISQLSKEQVDSLNPVPIAPESEQSSKPRKRSRPQDAEASTDLLILSDQLFAVVKQQNITGTQVVEEIWKYIKALKPMIFRIKRKNGSFIAMQS